MPPPLAKLTHARAHAHTRPRIQVIFADGTFVDGSTSELSADGPLREPFTGFAQGGTHHAHWALVLEELVDRLALEPAAAQSAASA